jgi:hypothetical protein
MNPDHYALVEMGFVGIVVLGIAIWQLVSVSREIARDKARGKMSAPEPADRSPEGAGHPVREHRLDDR